MSFCHIFIGFKVINFMISKKAKASVKGKLSRFYHIFEKPVLYMVADAGSLCKMPIWRKHCKWLKVD